MASDDRAKHAESRRQGPWQVWSWQEPSDPAKGSEDALVVRDESPPLRVGAIDGVTPSAATPSVEGLNGAQFAASALRVALCSPLEIASAAAKVNEQLVQRFGGLEPYCRPQAGFVAADLSIVDGKTVAKIVIACDCEAWARFGDEWQRILGEDVIDPKTRAAHRQWTSDNPGAELAETQEFERQLLRNPTSYTSPPIGRFERPTLRTLDLRGWDELVLASDGARLNPSRLADLEAWLIQIRQFETSNLDQDGVHRFKPHDDITVVGTSLV